MEIILARHGKTDLPLWVWITPRQMKEWIEDYDQADVLADDVCAVARAKASGADVVVSSTLRRCIRSAEALSRNSPFLMEEVFREADLPHSLWRFPRLPLAVWGVLFRFAWFNGYSGRKESFPRATERARLAAERLVELARQKGSVFHVGHGIMTMLIAKQLLAMGWSGPARAPRKHWQFSVYRMPEPAPAVDPTPPSL